MGSLSCLVTGQPSVQLPLHLLYHMCNSCMPSCPHQPRSHLQLHSASFSVTSDPVVLSEPMTQQTPAKLASSDGNSPLHGGHFTHDAPITTGFCLSSSVSSSSSSRSSSSSSLSAAKVQLVCLGCCFGFRVIDALAPTAYCGFFAVTCVSRRSSLLLSTLEFS